jgi:hypothetical protein
VPIIFINPDESAEIGEIDVEYENVIIPQMSDLDQDDSNSLPTVHQHIPHVENKGAYVFIGVLTGVSLMLIVIFCPIIYRIIRATC